MKTQSVIAFLVLALLAALFLTACGPKATTFTVDMKEFTFTPDTFSAPANSKVTLKLQNTGALDHEFVIMLFGKEATVPFDDDDEPNIYWEHELEPGESATVEFTAPAEPGTYQIVCGTAGHLEQGMKATLIVTK